MKKSILLLALLIFFSQLSFLPMLIPALEVNFVVAFVVALALYFSFTESILWVVCLGLLLDYYMVGAFGVNVIVLSVIAFMVDFIRNNLLPDRKSKVVLFAVIFLLKFSYDLFWCFFAKVLVFYHLSALQAACAPLNRGIYWTESILFSFIGVLMFRLLYQLDRTIGKKRRDLIVEK